MALYCVVNTAPSARAGPFRRRYKKVLGFKNACHFCFFVSPIVITFVFCMMVRAGAETRSTIVQSVQRLELSCPFGMWL